MENVMKQEELLKYMKDAIEVETDLATQEQFLELSLKEIENRKPILQLDSLPPVTVEAPKKSALVYIGYGFIVFAILLFVVSIVLGEWGSMIILPIGWGMPGVIMYLLGKKKYEEKNFEYNQQINHYNNSQKKNKKKQEEFDATIRQCNDSSAAFRASAIPHINETKALLEKLYNKNIIYPKYCTLPALTSIYEYFMTGRCTELTGPHGAYNLYEDEVRKDMIINRLDTVIENLEQIRYNQYTLYQQVKSIKKNSDAMVSELRQIKGYSIAIAELTALNAYYAARTERNTRISMYYDL